MPRLTLSVLIPNYNHGPYLPKALEAIVSQSRPPDELIILDDASTDNSVEVMQQFAARYPFVRVVQHEQNMGVVATIEDLLALATGDFVYTAAADDYALPGFFEQAMDMAEQHPEAAIISGKIVVVTPEGEEMSVAEASRWQTPLYASPEVFLKEYMDTEYPGHSLTCATLWRRDALLEIGGFRPELGHWSDSFALRAMALKHGACYVPERWATYRAMPGSFGQRQLQNHLLALQLLDRCAALMRSPEFADRFPEAHVASWQRKFQRMIFEDWVWHRRARFGRTRWGWWVGRVYKRCLLLKAALWHRGDLSALMRAEAGEQP